MVDFTNCPVDEPWVLWDAEGNSKLITTCAEFDYARLIIAQQALRGFYLTKPNDDTRYPINHYGNVENYPNGLFDACESMAADIIRAAMNTKYKETHDESYNID